MTQHNLVKTGHCKTLDYYYKPATIHNLQSRCKQKDHITNIKNIRLDLIMTPNMIDETYSSLINDCVDTNINTEKENHRKTTDLLKKYRFL